jgi:Zn-dependent peptidase ImmA (M78 family)
MSPWQYYEEMRALARAKRIEYEVVTATLNLTAVRKIYKKESILIDQQRLKGYKIKAAYYCDNQDYSVLVSKDLPREPKLFALVHELKHPYQDQEEILNGEMLCGDYNAHELIEKGAEVFAAEFIYPENEMKALISQMNITAANISPQQIVDFKRNAPASVSYTFIRKRFARFQICSMEQYKDVKFTKLEEEIHGLPIYKQEWFKQNRARKQAG